MKTLKRLVIEACGMEFKDAALEAGKLLDWMRRDHHTKGYTMGHERANAVGNWKEEPIDYPCTPRKP